MRTSRTRWLLVALAGALMSTGVGPLSAQADDRSDSIDEGLDTLTIKLPPPVIYEPIGSDR